MQKQASKLLYPELTEKIIGVYYDVYNEIGQGFLESVYSNCMQIALTQAGLAVQREVLIPVIFRNHDVGQFRSDLLVNKLILLELKAVQVLESLPYRSSLELSPRHRVGSWLVAQLWSDAAATQEAGF